MFYLTVLALGLFAFSRLPIELAPEVDFPKLSIVTTWGTTSPETMEAVVTSQIEEVANTVKGVRKVSSVSEEGRSTVSLEFQKDTDMDFARLELKEKLATLQEALPYGVSPPTVQKYVPEDFRKLQGFLTYTLSSNLSPGEIQRLAEQKLKPAVMSIKGVSNVEILGGVEREIKIELNPELMKSLNISLSDVSDALSGIELQSSSGYIVEAGQKVDFAIRNTIKAISEIEEQIIRTLPNSKIIRLKDIASVTDTFEEPRTFFRINGKPAITLEIDKEPGVNMLRVADDVYEKMESLKKSLPEIQIIKASDTSENLRQELGKLSNQSAFSVLCIAFVLLLFLRNLKAPFIILSSIFFSVAATILAFSVFGIGLNLITLAALTLAFGMLVDNSIVVLDNIHRHFESGEEQLLAVSSAVREVVLPVVASTLTTIGALLPVFFLPENLKLYFVQFALAVGVSLLLSLLVAFTLIPSLAYRVELRIKSRSARNVITTDTKRSLKNSNPRSAILNHVIPKVLRTINEAFDKLLSAYKSIIQYIIKHRVIAVLLTIWFFGLPVWLLPEKIETPYIAPFYNSIFGSKLYDEIRPYIDHILGGSSHLFFKYVTRGEVWSVGKETYVVVYVKMPKGTEIKRLDKVMRDIEHFLLDGINQTGVTHGDTNRAITKLVTRVYGEYANIVVYFTDEASTTAVPYIVKNALTAYAAQIGGADVGVYGYGPGFFTGGEAAPSFRVKVLGYNYNRVKEIAQKFKQQIERNPRIANVDIDRSLWGRDILFETAITIDRDRISRYGLTVVDIVRAIRTHTKGAIQLSRFKIQGEPINYSVKYAGYGQFSIDDLKNVVLMTPSGEQVRLGDILNISEQRVLSRIVRENQQYQRLVVFDYKGPYKYGDKFVDAAIKNTAVPNGYSIQRAEWFFLREEEEFFLLLIALFSLLIVFMITASLYESFLKPFVIILAVPMSLIGVFLAFYFTGATFDRGGYASIILLIGIVVNNSIVLVDRVSNLEKTVPSGFGNRVGAIVEAASHRLRPILMTTMTTIAGLLPLAIAGEPTSIWYSLSIGTIGGLISSTVLVLLVIPALYMLLVRRRKVL